jgi:tetratricopeptide (TPR) repeat protein
MFILQMMRRTMLIPLWLLFFSSQSLHAVGNSAGDKAVIKEYEQSFTTYPYSDPDPVPKMTKYYPYFRYDGFTQTPVQRKWKVVELSNNYLKVLILPEIGGKIWTAIDKTTGKPFIYYNHVVKFRDISMRGPWTSGGIEANYGIMGHTPDCFSPVDYLVRTNADGSISCIIGALDLLTRSTWSLEIRLCPGQACFTTRSVWHNGSELEEPYYAWMNAAIEASDDLEFIFPGTHYIYHDGKSYDWPINEENGHNISWYSQNNFGRSKSYHVLGDFSDFYGAYWHDEDFGMAHYSSYDDKPGRKIWIWGLSRQGMIWQKLLTDGDRQYVELQSGRLFNQAAPQSSSSPFKQKGFPPYATDTWEEQWMPVKGIQGFVSASSLGAMNVIQKDGQLVVGISPVRNFQGKLEIFDGDHLLSSQEVNLKPMEPVKKVISLTTTPRALRVSLGGNELVYASGSEDALNRPFVTLTNFDWESSYGLYLEGKELARQRNYNDAKSSFEDCLKKDPNFVPALVEMASLANRYADYAEAYGFARTALSIDTYEPGANYQFGLANAGMGNKADAKAAFGMAALDIGWRSAACTELAKEYLREKEYDRALEKAEESLDYNRFNLDALKLEACIARVKGDASGAHAALSTLLTLDPLGHFVEFEKYLAREATARDFTNTIRNDLPYETYLELAGWYHDVELNPDALKVLNLGPRQAEILYWQVYLGKDTNLLARADAASPEFVFPFRKQSVAVFEWASAHTDAWQPKYYLALIRWFQGKSSEAERLFSECGNQPEFAPFYAARAQIIESEARENLQRAAEQDPSQWRYGAMLVRYYLQHTNVADAERIAADHRRRFPENGTIIRLDAQSLIATRQYRSAIDLLMSANLLPAEGATQARALYREAYLRLSVEQMKGGLFHQALDLIAKAREWPENLGAGEPYPIDIDDRLEDWLTFQCYRGLGLQKESERALRILALQLWPKTGDLDSAKPRSLTETNASAVIHALALKELGRADEAQQLLARWRKDDPDDQLEKWGEDVLAGRSSALPPKCEDDAARIFYGWLQESAL